MEKKTKLNKRLVYPQSTIFPPQKRNVKNWFSFQTKQTEFAPTCIEQPEVLIL
jgi:hypothetical protein